MKKFTKTIIALLILSSCSGNKNFKSSNKNSASDISNPIVATYNDGQVNLKQVNIELEKLIATDPKLKGLTFDKLNAQQKEIIIKEVILKEICYKEAKKTKLDKEQDYQELLKNFESELLKQKLLLSLAKEASEEENVKKKYDELAIKIKDKKDFRIRYIIVKNKKEAETIYETLLKSPASFASLAKKKSLDKEVGKKGGDLGFVAEDGLPEDILKQVKALQKGQISQPFLTSNSWLIVKIEDHRPAQILAYDQAKEALAQSLAKKAMEDFLSQSFEKAKISILVK